MAERQLPFGSFNFLVDINDVTTAGFSDVSGLSTELTMAEYRNGNERVSHVHKVPGIHKVSDITLKRGVIKSADLWGWLNEVRARGQGMKRTVVISLLDESGQRVQGWKLHGTVPLKYSGPTLAAKGGGDVAMEELVLSAEEMEYLP